ncbi:hypothetical protein LV89_02860 [Arcicella aurantiaca]|uniref:Uncharacterized protein n=1 Tax=Arcicella aurantiaca TaxID=591202 RepID=A0A316E4A5_9BACT|nr:hypothetical protein [Arcicella aurantiaca]PWK25234.1 hypothetical protein LV89_02860 [Arcicella aurantiaca]
MKKPLFLLAIAILGIGGYVFYQKKNQHSNAITSFIPDNTLLLLETNQISAAKNKVIQRFPLLSQAALQFLYLKRIGLSEKEINDLLLKKTLYFAILPEGKDDCEFVNYLPLNADNEDFIEKLDNLKQNTSGKRIISHITQGFKISEVIDENSKSIFAFIVQDNFLIFSISSLVLEEAVLHKKNKWVTTLSLNKNVIDNDSVFTQTHFNSSAVNDFLGDISIDGKSNHFSYLLANTYQWLQPNKNIIEAIGTTNNSLFEGQKPATIQCLNMIPNSSSYILNVSYSNPESLYKKIEAQIENNDKINKLRNKASSAFDYDYSDLYRKINDEITLCSFDNTDQSIYNKVLIIKQKELLKPLKVIARNVASNRKEDVFNVQYGSFGITSLGIKEFPSMLLGEMYGGFEECYFTEYRDYIIMASSLGMMQDYLQSIGKGDVWSNSAKNKTILKNCIPANLTFIAESEKAIKGLGKILNNKWATKLQNKQNELLNVQAEILQQNTSESRIVLLRNIEPTKTPQKFANKWVKLSGIAISAQREPLYLINPSSKNLEILVQGNDNKLRLFDNGKSIWTYALSDKIIGQIKNVSISKESAQQLLVVTGTKIYALTRTKEGFEVKSSKNPKKVNFSYFNVFENEADKNENLTLVSDNGETFKINKETLVITSSHKSLRSQVILPIPSLIIKGSENAVILEKTGNLSLQNSKGTVLNGFPVKLNSNFSSAPVLEGANNNLVIRVLSDKGELYKISIEGKILEKKQLFRPNNEVKFLLAPDARNKDWVVMRTDGKEVVVMDKNETELFTVKDLNYGKKELKYYNLGTAGKYFAITNGYTTYRFYNELGESVGTLPIVSEFPPNISYSDSYKKIMMNITSPSSIETWSVKIR